MTFGDAALIDATSVLDKAALLSRYPVPRVNKSYELTYVIPVAESVAVLYAGNDFVAVFISRALMVSGVRPGFFCSIRATVPDTTGVAMLVPLSWKYWAAPAFLEVV